MRRAVLGLGGHPPRGELPSACMRSSSSLNYEEASVGVVTFGARSLDCTMILVGPMERGKPGLIRDPGASPGLFLTVPGAGWSGTVL